MIKQLKANVYLKKIMIIIITIVLVFSFANPIYIATANDTKASNEKLVNLAQPVTNIVGDIAFLEYVTNQAELTTLTNVKSKPASVIVYVNKDLEITDENYKNAFTSVEKLLLALDNKIMPVFYVGDAESARILSSYLKDEKVIDAFVMSNIPQAVKSAKTEYGILRGVIDFSASTQTDLSIIRATASENLARIVLLNPSLATDTNISYLMKRYIITWTKAMDLGSDDTVGAYNLILSGTYGIASSQTTTLVNIATGLEQNTLVRTPINIGHRGLPTKAPENSLLSAIAAYKNGADSIECDVYITSDGHLVTIHDKTTGKLFNKDLVVEESTLSQLKQLHYKSNSDVGIATLEEFFKEFADKDIVFTIEMKSKKTSALDELIRLIKDHKAYEQCHIITFNAGQISYLRNKYPEMTTTLVTSVSGANATDTLKTSLTLTQPINASWGPNWELYKDSDFFRMANLRGLATAPWSVSAIQAHDYVLLGSTGVTTNNCDHLSTMINAIKTNLVEGEKTNIDSSIPLNTIAYNGLGEIVSKELKSNFEIISGSDLAKIEDGKLVGKGKTGIVTVLANTNIKTVFNEYTLYSKPVSIEFFDENQIKETEVELFIKDDKGNDISNIKLLSGSTENLFLTVKHENLDLENFKILSSSNNFTFTTKSVEKLNDQTKLMISIKAINATTHDEKITFNYNDKEIGFITVSIADDSGSNSTNNNLNEDIPPNKSVATGVDTYVGLFITIGIFATIIIITINNKKRKNI